MVEIITLFALFYLFLIFYFDATKNKLLQRLVWKAHLGFAGCHFCLPSQTSDDEQDDAMKRSVSLSSQTQK